MARERELSEGQFNYRKNSKFEFYIYKMKITMIINTMRKLDPLNCAIDHQDPKVL